MLGNFNEDVQIIIMKAKDEMMALNHPYVGSEHLLLSILKNDEDLSSRLKNYNLTYDSLKKEIIKVIGIGSKKSPFVIYTPMLKKIISNALLDSKDNNDGVVTTEHLLSAMLERGEGIAIRLLVGMNIDVDLLYNEFCSRLIKKNKKSNKKSLLKEVGVDLNKLANEGKMDPVIGREKEINRILEILGRRNKNNPLLVGDAGVGKTAIIEHIASLIEDGELPSMKGKRIISLSMSSLVSGTKYRGEFEEKLQKLINELENDDSVILFIDEIHTLVGAGGAEGAIDASNIFKPALARGIIKCIGATTYDEYNKYIAKDKALERRFQKVLIKEPSDKDMEKILLDIKKVYEDYHGVVIENELIPSIIKLSNKYVYDRKKPDRAIDILDEACSMVGIRNSNEYKKIKEIDNKIYETVQKKNSYIMNNNMKKAYDCLKLEFIYRSELDDITKFNNKQVKKVSLDDIAHVISSKCNVSVYDVLKDDISVIDELYYNLKKEIRGQDKAISSLMNISKRIKFGYNNKVRSLMFTGPSGVGKTMLSSLFAKEMVGEDNFLRFDMSEFSDSTSINKFLGSSAGYVGYDEKNYLDEIKKRPNGIILFDEIDKAHSSIINLLYQILDYGKLKDSRGNEVRFDNNIIIMTTNVGYESNTVGFNENDNKNIEDKLNEFFGSAFMNRIDDIVLFNYLNEVNVKNIIINKLNDLKDKYSSYNLDWINNEVDNILMKCDFKRSGARDIDRIIVRDVESRIIDQIIDERNKIKE